MADAWDEDETLLAASDAGITTLSLVVREDGVVVDNLRMPEIVTLDVALGQLPAAKSFQRKLAQFVAACEQAVIEHMVTEEAKEIPGFALERPTSYVVADPRAFRDSLLALVDAGKLSHEDYYKAVTEPPPVEPLPTFDNRTLNSLAAKRGAAVADVIHAHRLEMPGAPKLKLKG